MQEPVTLKLKLYEYGNQIRFTTNHSHNSAERARLEIARSRSPSSQKKVRFADSLGLELISVKHFDDTDMPEIPDRIINKFKKGRALHLNNFDKSTSSVQSTFMEMLFTVPGTLPDFLDRVKEVKVLLERVETDEFSISGIVRVLNVAFEKSVSLRYTMNNWITFIDILASYIPHSSDGFTDKFSFKIITPTFLDSGGTLQFAIKYTVNGAEFWDNNDGNNYKPKSQETSVATGYRPSAFTVLKVTTLSRLGVSTNLPATCVQTTEGYDVPGLWCVSRAAFVVREALCTLTNKTYRAKMGKLKIKFNGLDNNNCSEN
uniref:CBM21 domain-containing protein n=1 Tax=Electrophorus electricus TaxID=8005 RepID=A0A4W4GEW6_ELEEL